MISDAPIISFEASSFNNRISSLFDATNKVEYLVCKNNSEDALKIWRGRIIFQGSSQATGEKWSYEALYDLSKIPQEDDELNEKDTVQIDLILTDSSHDICLSVSARIV